MSISTHHSSQDHSQEQDGARVIDVHEFAWSSQAESQLKATLHYRTIYEASGLLKRAILSSSPVTESAD